MERQMIISGLRARPVRTSVSILAVALEVVLILVIIGLTNGISNETGFATPEILEQFGVPRLRSAWRRIAYRRDR